MRMLNKRPFRRQFWFFGLLFLLAGCSSGPVEKLWLKAPGWSRALLVANATINDPVTMALDGDGRIYLLTVLAEDGLALPQVTALNRRGETLWQNTINAPMVRPDKPRIIWDGRHLNLFWLSDQQLIYARMTGQGELAGDPIPISGEAVVGGFDVRLDGSGRLTVWYAGSRREPGLYAFAPGEVGGTAVLVDPAGIRPTLRYDQAGILHASWAHYPTGFDRSRFLYGEYPDGIFTAGQEKTLLEPFITTTSVMFGPWLGLSENAVYYFWTVEVRTGDNAGEVATRYLTFPNGSPETAEEETATAPGVSEFEYAASEPAGGYLAGARVSLAQYPAFSPVTDVAVPAGTRSELPMAFRVTARYQYRQVQSQVAVMYLADGRPTTYQLLSFESNPSETPALLADESGYLYLTWLQRDLQGYRVYFASTAPDLVDALASVTRADISRLSGEVLFGLLSGAVLSPFLVFLWLLLPLGVLAVTAFLRREDRGIFTQIGTVFSLGAGILVYWLVKILTLPGMRAYIPFSAWIPILPDWLQAPLQFGVPVLVTMAGIAAAWHFTYRRHSRSPLYFMFIFAAVDGVLTLSVYGFLVYNAL